MIESIEQKGECYETTMPLLKSMYHQFEELTKKKQEAAVSKRKIAIVNRLLDKVRLVLDDEDSIEFLDLLDENEIPQNSDVTLILSQYVAAMAAFRKTYYKRDSSDNEYKWLIEKNDD
ncbi:hypothetical protein I4641_13835 [Waterburya agarophytonicola K14]|uniref:Uncharacterized protein n=1 Tax=Waterburya agarophytonicola KI4 TaxID=2874699 RepID=A0A964FGI4_9CYAN|nr:hypothetical protein [Waterburya agarophytonicola]MCC0178061.1 hypothetical protein [Waterburya agarophytonicola KI4]